MGGNDPDRFLTVDGRLVLTPTVEELIEELPDSGQHSFQDDEQFLTFRREVKRAYSPGATGGDESGLYDFAATLPSCRLAFPGVREVA
ncbi:hypothetical protein [Micromonospora sp. RTP1Z1]|uniref:hypothetical protein n=1 Tax=Micromonospora sp. RTP1Z1 TaxID=2994043 RepID=UPI0029C69FD3|nr:hypothetical protein [Micromonospora sp. RTP1Z1]